MRSVLTLSVAVVLMGLLAGCAQKFTRTRYETVYVGQPAADVQRTLGQPTVEFSDHWSYVNSNPFYKANIYFDGGRVVEKVWFDPQEMGHLPTSEEIRSKSEPGPMMLQVESVE